MKNTFLLDGEHLSPHKTSILIHKGKEIHSLHHSDNFYVISRFQKNIIRKCEGEDFQLLHDTIVDITEKGCPIILQWDIIHFEGTLCKNTKWVHFMQCHAMIWHDLFDCIGRGDRGTQVFRRYIFFVLKELLPIHQNKLQFLKFKHMQLQVILTSVRNNSKTDL